MKPYITLDSVPTSVPEDQKQFWVDVWNLVYSTCRERVGGNPIFEGCDLAAFAIAKWTVDEHKTMAEVEQVLQKGEESNEISLT